MRSALLALQSSGVGMTGFLCQEQTRSSLLSTPTRFEDSGGGCGQRIAPCGFKKSGLICTPCYLRMLVYAAHNNNNAFPSQYLASAHAGISVYNSAVYYVWNTPSATLPTPQNLKKCFRKMMSVSSHYCVKIFKFRESFRKNHLLLTRYLFKFIQTQWRPIWGRGKTPPLKPKNVEK